MSNKPRNAKSNPKPKRLNIGSFRPKQVTKTEKLHEMCSELVGHVKTLGQQQIQLHEVVMQTTAQVKVLANVLEVLKTKGLITDEEIKQQIEETKIQNAKQDKSTEHPEVSDSGPEESGSSDEVHIADSSEESEVSASASE